MAATPRMKARKKYRLLKRTIPEGEEIGHLNITPMMDMMTILLIFFLKNFAVSVENVNLGEDLMLPRSSTQIKPHQAVQVTITKRAILVESGDRQDQVASVKDGAVDSSVKPEGLSSFLISPLLTLLQKHATRLKRLEKIYGEKMKFKGEVVIIADQTTPYRLISEILYTAGQAEYGKYRLMVLKGG